MAETSVTPQVGDIWKWKAQWEGHQDEYWLITKLPDIAMILSGPNGGETDEITIFDMPHAWEKVA